MMPSSVMAPFNHFLHPLVIAVGSDVSDGFVDWIELDHSLGERNTTNGALGTAKGPLH